MLQQRAAENSTTLRVECLTPIPQAVLTDPTRLRQVLFNLVGNSVKFTSSGSVTTELSILEPEGQPALLRIDIVDAGAGISTENAEMLFKPFTQADATTTRRYGGTGLGLTVSQRIANRLGGSVTLVESAEGRGSRFRAEVYCGIESRSPAHRPGEFTINEATDQDARAQTADDALAGRRILLIEDGEDNRRLIVHFLTKVGATVETAENGKDGSDMAEVLHRANRGYDLILCDIQMPTMDGYEAITRIRDAGIGTPVVALTAHAMGEYRDKCLASGFTDFLTKPIDRAGLIETCAAHCSQRPAHPAAA